MKYVMGVDHGGTKTKAMVADLSGNIAAHCTVYSAEVPVYSGLDVTTQVIADVLKKSSLTIDDIVCCTIGFSGADWDFEYPLIKEKLTETTGLDCCHIVNDCIAAMRGGLDKDYGGVVCIGTGLNIALINENGESYIYGHLINEEDCGAGSLGQKVIWAVRNELTRMGEKTLLTEMVLQYFNEQYGINLKNAYELFVAITTGSPTIPLINIVVKNLTPLLTEAAKTDQVALEIIDDYCRRLSKYVLAASRRLNLLDTAYEVVLSGGVMKSGNLIRDLFQEHLKACLPRVQVKIAEYEPVCGAVMSSYDQIKIGKKTIQAFKNNCDAQGFRLISNEKL